MARYRDQNGSVVMSGSGDRECWWGRYAVYVPGPNGKDRRKQRRVRLGLTSSMSESQARIKLRIYIDRAESVADKLAALQRTPKQASGPNGSKHGAICEMLATVDLMRNGYEVFRAVDPTGSFDMVAFKDEVFYRLEVKAGDIDRNGRPTCSYRRNIGRFDLLVVVNNEGKVTYLTSEQAAKFLGKCDKLVILSQNQASESAVSC